MPDENEVYLAVPYLNEDGLELYTKLILRKLASLVISSNTNVHDYEQEYSANPAVEVKTLQSGMEPDTIYTLPLSYGVGTGQLRVTVSGYIMYPGIDYEEVGGTGEISNQIKFLTSIEPGSILGLVLYPQQFSFGRNINVSSVVAPELALSESPASILELDDEGKLLLRQSKVEEIVQSSVQGFLHVEGPEDVLGQKTFKTPLNVDLKAANLLENEFIPVVNVSFKANGMNYNLKPINVLAGSETDTAYSGALMVGSNTGCTWIGSGESFLELPRAFNHAGIDFANDESVIVSSDTKISFYVGCDNGGASFTKAAEFLSDGTTRLYGTAYAPTPQVEDNSSRIATTEFVKLASLSVDGNQEITGQKTFRVSPIVPTPDYESNDNSAASTEFVKGSAVLLHEDQNIDGQKTFLSDVSISNAEPQVNLTEDRVVRGTLPAGRMEGGIAINDRLGNSLGLIKHRIDTSGDSSLIFRVANAASEEANDTTAMGISINHLGKPKTFAPTPELGDYSSSIATTKYVIDLIEAFKTTLLEKLQDVCTFNEENPDLNLDWIERIAVSDPDYSEPDPDQSQEPDPENPENPDEQP